MKNTRKNRSKKNKTRKLKRIFTIEEYNSNDGFLTSIWGSSTWHFLHTLSFNYPVNPSEEDKHNYRDFILSFRNVLPCGKCRKNLKLNFKKLPLTIEHMKNRETFSKYIYNLHELINKMLNKTSNLSYKDVRERYEHFRSRCLKNIHEEIKLTEKGCTEPLYGVKTKCVLKVVPDNEKCESMEIDKKCFKTREPQLILNQTNM